MRNRVDVIKNNMGSGERLKDDVEMVFMKCLKHSEKKSYQIKAKFAKIISKSKISEEQFTLHLKKAKIFYDLNLEFFSKIDFDVVIKNLQKFSFNKLNYYILEKVINMKNLLKRAVPEDHKRVYINTLRTLENNQFFDECLNTANLLKYEKVSALKIKNSIDDFLLNPNMKQYLSFISFPPQEITTSYYFKLKILYIIDMLLIGNLERTKEELKVITEEFVCNSFNQKLFINLLQEVNSLLKVLWYNNFDSKKKLSSNKEIEQLFRKNKIDESPENLFHIQIRRVLCNHLKFQDKELKYIEEILHIYKARNDSEMVRKYLNLYQDLTTSSNNIIQLYYKLKYFYFLGDCNKFSSIFNKNFDPNNYYLNAAKDIWEAKMILMKFKMDYSNKISDDDTDHSNLILFIDKNKKILNNFHDSNRELEAKMYYIAGNFKAFDSVEYSDIQSILKDTKDKIFIENIQLCCKYFLLASICTKKFKYLFKLLPKSIKLFKIIHECKPSQSKNFIIEYGEIIQKLDVNKIAFVFQFLVDNGVDLPFYSDLIAKFTNKYPNYSIYSLVSTYGLEDLNDSSIQKSENRRRNNQEVWKKIKPLLQTSIKKNLESSNKFLKLLFKIKNKKGDLSDNERINIITKVISDINDLLSKEEVLLPKNVFDLLKFQESLFEPISINKELIYRIDNKFDVYNSLAKPVKLSNNFLKKVFEIKENGNMKTVPYIFKSDKEVHHEIVAAEFFECCNKILKLNKNTKYLNLNMSLYQIVKLDSESLMIEFIENTTMLKSLISREWIKCGQTLDFKNPNHEELKNKLNKWTSTDNLNFPNYFIDKCHDPNLFYDNKLNFIKSSAIWSIAGYLIGLGDRHCQNILVKQNSEVVHIDYGIILGRGKQLPVPEVVQFRLTPNISQGLDIFEGKALFYYYCYIILNAFSKEKGSIFEILESVYKVNGKTNDVKNLIKKLDNVSCNDILKLLESCSDKEKLKKMYVGWAPWC